MNFALIVLMMAHATPGEVPVREARGTLVDTAGNAVAGSQVVVTSEPDVVRLRRILWLGRLYPDSALRRDMAAVTVAGEATRPAGSKFTCRKIMRPADFPIRSCSGSFRRANCGPSSRCRGWLLRPASRSSSAQSQSVRP